MIAVDIFRVEDGMVVEHWDVMQEEVASARYFEWQRHVHKTCKKGDLEGFPHVMRAGPPSTLHLGLDETSSVPPVWRNEPGVNSRPWQTFSGYQEGPLTIVSMSRGEMERDCNCIFLGKRRYAGTNCAK